ncbi:unnamed protein product [Durusdinium trenchii]|uniref:Cation/H+ exchanger transmembrane domain-containing protein n=1 Tax=Durusdinium trenchii TaxID=1381693 RepID=A0ABP0MRY6_9DINO
MRCVVGALLVASAAAAYCEGVSHEVNGTLVKDHGHGGHGEHDVALESMLPISCALILAFVLSSSMESFHITFFPESGVVILIGLGLGFIFKALLGEVGFGSGELIPSIGPAAVKSAFLPIIIFESGWSLRWKDFASQVGYILIFAVIGTMISMTVVGLLIVATSEYHGVAELRTAFAYGSLIAATDPVATLATYASLKVDPVLNVMVFGESMINDAVAIVVFEIMNSDEVFGDPCDHQTVQSVPLAILAGIGQKLVVSVLSGAAAAIALTLLLRFASLKHAQLMEILYIMASAYLMYGLAETLHASGIIATLLGSMLMGIYSKPHLSSEGLMLATFFVKGMATLADTFTFMIVGIGAVAVSTEPRAFHFSLWVMLFCLVGRAACILFCGGLANLLKVAIGRMKRQTDESEWLLLSGRHLFMMWHAGLRGAIALVLCWELGPWVDETEGQGTKETLVTSTLVVICVFLLIFGGTTQCLLSSLSIRMGDEFPEDYLSGHMMNCIRNCGGTVDRKILWPCLVGGPEHKDESLPEITRHAIHELLHETGLSHRSQAFYRRSSSLASELGCYETEASEEST